MKLNEKGLEFIINEETGGRDYYEKIYKKTFIWPGGSSGPTALVGIDIGYYDEQELKDIFGPMTSDTELKLILGGRGKTGLNGKLYTQKLKGITFEWDEALNVFKKFTLPKFSTLTTRTFPGVDELHENAQAALLSLVFNRGGSLMGSRRAEMKKIRDLVPLKDYKGIATQVRAMKRLWPNTRGLLRRRDREAQLIESYS